ncbi:MAG: cytidine deaminase [Eubacterium sp.]|nr:cytidine deaminase [Eubacterium sp.]
MEELIRQAMEARKNSYSPYSGFQVGAALLCKDGTVYTGCNVENAAYGPSNCAERTAVFKAVSEGKREFERIAVVGGHEGESVAPTPCGVCRQVLSEFCEPSFEVIMAVNEQEYEVMTLGELLPRSFDLE